MNILYKYTNFFGIRDLIDHHLRLSLTSTLNDPFEGVFNEKLEYDMLSKFNVNTFKLNIPSHVPDWVKEKLVQNNIRTIKDLYGIISLSETPRNLLMWAHYANEHTGICIGYRNNILDCYQGMPKSNLGLESTTAIKVNYDNLRPHELRRTDLDESEVIQELKNHFITKSDDWIYEKEHRYIIPINWTTKIKLLGETDVHSPLMQAIKQAEEYRSIQRTSDPNKFEYKVRRFNYFHPYAHNKKNVAYLIKVNPADIVSIHLGCKIRKEQREEIEDYIKCQDSKLKHVKIYRSKPNRKRFELDFE